MSSLYVLRHADATWNTSSGGDHGRPLSDGGRRAASRVGSFLTQLGEPPDRALVSSAQRTRETWALASRSGSWGCAVEALDSLYETSTERAIEVLRRHGGRSRRLLIVGHQPTMSDLVAQLIQGGRIQIATAALLRLDFALDDWRQLEAGQASLIWMVVPGLLDAPRGGTGASP